MIPAPAFWNRPRPDWRARALAPLAAIYARATARRVAQAPAICPTIPVICVGNLNAGGTGKTPTVIALAQRLAGSTPWVVSRGYGGAETGPVRVDPDRHGPAEVGDEPLLIAAFAPVVVARDRAEGVRMAEAGGAGVILLDDGFQNPSVAKDLSFVVVDAAIGFGNGMTIPAGPLREPVEAGLARARAVISIGEEADQDAFRTRWEGRIDLPVLYARLAALPTGLPLRDLRALAFAGIGRPEKFFQTLRSEGVDLVRTVPLGDHQPLTPALMARLEREAKAAGAQLVTTEKDAVRLPAAFRSKVLTLPVRLEFDDPDTLDRLFAPLISGEAAP